MKKRCLIRIFTLFFLFLFAGGYRAFAEANNLSFSMNVIQPENQVDKSVTYFDILTKPGDKQKLELQVTNTGKNEEVIVITPTNAVTNSSGVLDYSIKDKEYEYDETLTIPFTSLVSAAQEVKVGPGKTEVVSFDFNAPEQPFNGIILGGFLAKTLDKDNNTTNSKNKVSFINKFQVVKAVMIRSSEDTKVEPNIKLNEVKPALHNYRTSVIANIQNTTPVLLKQVQVKAEIVKSGSSKVVKSVFRNDIELAPNTNFNFPIMWGSDPLEAGEYTLNLSVNTEEKEFIFDRTFNISKEDSYRINEKAVNVKEEKKDYMIWIILGIVIGVLIVILLVFVLYKQNKLSKKQKNKGKSKKHKK